MDDVSLSPMHNADIFRTYWAIQKIMNREKSWKQKFEGQNKYIKSVTLQSKKRWANRDATVANGGGRRQALDEGISDHCMCTQRYEFDKTGLDEFVHEIAVDVNVTRKFSANRIFTHNNIG